MNAHRFCNSLETGLFGMLVMAHNSRSRNVDHSGQHAVDMLGTELRRERRGNALLRSRVAELELQLAAAQDAITLLA